MAEAKSSVAEMEHSSDADGLPRKLPAGDMTPAEAARLAGLRTVEGGLTSAEVVAALDKAEEARILRKVDLRLVPLLSFLYL